ncbi:molybdopterin converting factor small subunit [Haloactinopolyspora alba]|uniref:Molybdopterin converting factor small subunit n=1 Tax=Haloactinopolyspora alba TaxID=648780 RepID=A0A2P8DK11_9ACTN|nr:MoaD/ThiS family protein [Haloactinopolyspora alba]PSK97557.1 molybdopterin converting factor small subunit [Haloactinopolyspora alba]
MARVTMRYWAAMRAAAGVNEQLVDADTLDTALRAVRAGHEDDSRFARVLGICAVVVDGTPAGARPYRDIVLHEGSVVELLPPFAGG